jgi:hypothetical protein
MRTERKRSRREALERWFVGTVRELLITHDPQRVQALDASFKRLRRAETALSAEAASFSRDLALLAQEFRAKLKARLDVLLASAEGGLKAALDVLSARAGEDQRADGKLQEILSGFSALSGFEPLIRLADSTSGEIASRGWASLSRIRCPCCRWVPRQSDRWSCNCSHQWNTFDTRGTCPGCAYRWLITQCLRCAGISLHEDWYEGKPLLH